MSADTFAFDGLAADYDESFSSSVIGGKMRRAVWRRLEGCFASGDRVLELGCGTGEDAVFLGQRGIGVLATDRSAEMVTVARRKVRAAGCGDLVTVRQRAIEDLSSGIAAEPPFDGALSNFGALNCIEDLSPVAADLAAALRPGASVVLCVMGPWVPWEWLWFLARGRPREAFRRLRPGGTDWRGMKVFYPSIGALKRTFGEAFEARHVTAVGAFLPPSYAESWAARHPRLIARLDRWERRFEACYPLPQLADHYLLELERR